MAITLNEDQARNVLEVRVTGKLTHQDYQQFAPRFEAMIKQRGKLNILFEMVDFRGWEVAAVWDDIKLDVKHFSDVTRIAMVGDKAWEKAMSVVCRPFTTAKIRFFEPAALADARAWVAGAKAAET